MDLEFRILDVIQETIACQFLDFLLPKITFLGNAGMIWSVTALAMLCSKKYRMTGIQLCIGLLAGILIGNLLLKNIVLRDRPCWIRESMELLIAVPRDFSFPSGHSLSSFCAAGIISQNDRRIGIAAYVLAAMIAFSRLYLYVHFPTDVLAGIVIGTIIAFAVVKLSQRYIHLNKQTESDAKRS